MLSNLQDIAKSSATAQVVFDELAARQRNRKVTDLRRFKGRLMERGKLIDDDEFKNIWVQLEEAGVGEIIEVVGKPPRFKWKKSLKTVGQKAAKSKASDDNDGDDDGGGNGHLPGESSASFTIDGVVVRLSGPKDGVAALIKKLF